MLTRGPARQGFTLIEMMIALAIVALVLAIGAPNFSVWLQNTQIRNAAESIKSGLVFAQMEAMRRNTPVRFQLMSSTDSDCALSTTQPNWVVNVGNATTNDPSGACGPASETAPFIIKSVPAADGMRNVVLDSSQSTVVFNSYGQASNVTGAATISVTNPQGGSCVTSSGPMNCLRVTVSSSGQIRMCNPNTNLNGTPMGCS